MQKFIPIGKAAEFLNVSIDTIRRWDKLGILHSSRPGGKVRYFDLQDLKRVKSSKPFNMAALASPSKVKVGLLLAKILLLLLTILTVLFLLFPEQTARLFTSFM